MTIEEPTTKNDLAQERYQDLIEYFGDEKVAKTILESRKEFKAWLERIRWHVKKADELARELEQLKGTTKNDLGVDCIDRKALLNRLNDFNKWCKDGRLQGSMFAADVIGDMPSVTSQQPKIKVLDRNEVARKLGTVDVYKANAWITLLKDLEYLGLKICEVEE